MAEVKTEDIKVGEVYRVRLSGRGNGIYGTARVVAIHTALGHPNIVSGIKVEWLDGERERKVFSPTVFETV